MGRDDKEDLIKEQKIIEEYQKVIQTYEQAKAKGTLSDGGSVKGLKGNRTKGWQEQIQQMRARVERFTREHGKHGRHH